MNTFKHARTHSRKSNTHTCARATYMVATLDGKMSLPSTVAITGSRSSTLYRDDSDGGDDDDDDDDVDHDNDYDDDHDDDDDHGSGRPRDRSSSFPKMECRR